MNPNPACKISGSQYEGSPFFFLRYGSSDPAFSFITCTHRPDDYKANVMASLTAGNKSGFELIAFCNTDNLCNVPQALNMALDRAVGKYVVACHHDVIFPAFWLDILQREISRLDAIDDSWGVIGVMGVGPYGNHLGAIRDPHSDRVLGPLPAKVQTLDEVCLVFKRGSGLTFAEELNSHHLYGADLCIQSYVSGHACYAVDAPLTHLSAGAMDDGFRMTARLLRERWEAVTNAPAIIETTCSVIRLKPGLLHKIDAARRVLRRRFIWRMGSIRHLKHL